MEGAVDQEKLLEDPEVLDEFKRLHTCRVKHPWAYAWTVNRVRTANKLAGISLALLVWAAGAAIVFGADQFGTTWGRALVIAAGLPVLLLLWRAYDDWSASNREPSISERDDSIREARRIVDERRAKADRAGQSLAE